MTPEEIIDHFGIEHPREIDIEAICFHFNATIEKMPLTGCEGRLIGFNNKAIITVNSESSLNRQKFSAAHELGHWTRDKGSVSHICTEETILNAWNFDNPEVRANKFAAKLLMPEKFVREHGKNKKFKIKDMTILADLFGVSLTAFAVRFLKLDLASGMLIWSDGVKRNMFMSNPSYPKSAWPIDIIDSESGAAFIKDKDVGYKYNCAEPADVWINRTDSSHYELFEDSIVISPGVILTLLSWPDEAYLIKLSEH